MAQEDKSKYAEKWPQTSNSKNYHLGNLQMPPLAQWYFVWLKDENLKYFKKFPKESDESSMMALIPLICYHFVVIS